MLNFKNALPALAVIFASLSPSIGHADDVAVTPGQELYKTPARQGWFWYKDPAEAKKKDVPPPAEPASAPQAEQPKPAAPIVVITKTDDKKDLTPEEKEKLCHVKDTWDKTCGFVDPGDDFDFQAKERDSLLQMMSLTPENPDAVEQAQRYMKWVVTKASMAANMWYFNMVQKPELDPTVKNPISEVGIALATRITQASQYEYFKLIKEEGGTLFYFSRSDCSYCYDQAPYAARVAHTMGLNIVNIPLDGKCLPDFTGLACGDNVKPEQAAVLDVKIVPSLYLYVPSNTWIRLGTGVMTDQTILANTVNFFSAYRAAMLQGLDNSGGTTRPSVTFDPQFNQKPTGVAPADGSQLPAGLDRNRMMDLLGYGKKK
jgi:conjugal transfer pilus assembly protein TraF